MLVYHLLGNFLDQQSASFHQEFPQLASGEEKAQMAKRADESREAQHGPVLDPKHQGTVLSVSRFTLSSFNSVICMDACSRSQYTLREILTVKAVEGQWASR